MSTAKNQTFKIWQDVRAKLGRVNYQLFDCDSCTSPVGRVCTRAAGNYQFVDRCAGKATQRQNRVIADGMTLMLIVWSDSVLSPLKYETIRNLTDILVSVPVGRLVSCLKDADAFLIAEVQKERICTYNGFKHHIGKRYPDLKGLFSPTQALWNELRISEDRSLATRRLHTMFSFITRLNVPDRKDLEAAARAKFLEQELDLSPSCTIQDGGEPIVLRTVYTGEEQQILCEWFPNHISVYESIYGKWVPQHGTGSVADSSELSLKEKYAALGTDDDLRYLDLYTGGAGYCRSRKGFARIAGVVFVPKSIDKLRTICKEPTTLMFYQQGFMHTIVDYIHNHRYLSKRIRLDRAYLNADMARIGSLAGEYATIDLSAASDSVSWDLIRAWFPHTPLWEALACTRSNEYTLKKEKARATNKFAPMGSALCFPTECLVFAAMCEAVVRESGENPSNSNYRVYGDDIIIETRFAEALIRRLEANGFKVNTDKSFYHVTPHNYRESCGGEYLDGRNVTPFRISRKFEGLDLAVKEGQELYYSNRWVALVDLCNRAFLWLPTVRSFVINELLKLPPQFQPFFTDEWRTSLNSEGKSVYEVSAIGGLVTFDASNYRLKARKAEYASCIQPIMYQHGCVRSGVGVQGYADEDIRLYEWLRSTHGRSESSVMETSLYLSHTPTTRSQGAKMLVSTWSKSLDVDRHPQKACRQAHYTVPIHISKKYELPDVDIDIDLLHKGTAYCESYTCAYSQEDELSEWLLHLDWD